GLPRRDWRLRGQRRRNCARRGRSDQATLWFPRFASGRGDGAQVVRLRRCQTLSSSTTAKLAEPTSQRLPENDTADSRRRDAKVAPSIGVDAASPALRDSGLARVLRLLWKARAEEHRRLPNNRKPRVNEVHHLHRLLDVDDGGVVRICFAVFVQVVL